MSKLCVSTFLLAACIVTATNQSSAGSVLTDSPDFLKVFETILSKISAEHKITLELDKILSIDQTAGRSGSDYVVYASIKLDSEIRVCRSHIEDVIATFNPIIDLHCGEKYYKIVLK